MGNSLVRAPLGEAYTPLLRSDALAMFQSDYPELFDDQFLSTRALKDIAMGPSDELAKNGTPGYHAYVARNDMALYRYWNTFAPLPSQARIYQLKQIVKANQLGDGSVNNMWLYMAEIGSSRYLPLTDGRSSVVIKSQNMQSLPDQVSRARMYYAIFEFTNEVIIARVLNTLVTGFRYTVTPHFTTFLGAFAGQEIIDVLGNEQPLTNRIYAVYERAELSMVNFIRNYELSAALLGSFLFQLLSGLEAAARLVGLQHGDLHLGNVMVRRVAGTTYADRTWAYKRADEPSYYFIGKASHLNFLVEIIDLGRSTLMPRVPTTPEIALRFATDASRMLVHLLDILDTRHEDPLFKPHKHNVMQWIVDAQEMTDVPEKFLREWPRIPGAGTAALFGSFSTPDPGTPPLLVSLVPATTILDATGDNDDVHMVVRAISRLWESVASTKRRTCTVCHSPATYRAEKSFFCGRDCYHVHYGIYHSISDVD